MNAIDQYLLVLINSFAHKSYLFDELVTMIGDSNLTKGAVFISLLWLAWFSKSENLVVRREFVISTLYASIISIIAIKILRSFVPFRNRPIHEKLIDFVLPYGDPPDTLWNWSSFPSDTAGFAMALAVGQVYIWGRKGWLVVVFCFVFVCVPRIYLGYHYPSDIAAGALIGGLIAATMCQYKIRTILSRGILSLSEAYRGIFYFCFFLLSYEIAVVFEDIRRILTQLSIMMHHG